MKRRTQYTGDRRPAAGGGVVFGRVRGAAGPASPVTSGASESSGAWCGGCHASEGRSLPPNRREAARSEPVSGGGPQGPTPSPGPRRAIASEPVGGGGEAVDSPLDAFAWPWRSGNVWAGGWGPPHRFHASQAVTGASLREHTQFRARLLPSPPYRTGGASRNAVERICASPCSNSASSGALPLPGRMSVDFLARSTSSSSA